MRLGEAIEFAIGGGYARPTDSGRPLWNSQGRLNDREITDLVDHTDDIEQSSDASSLIYLARPSRDPEQDHETAIEMAATYARKAAALGVAGVIVESPVASLPGLTAQIVVDSTERIAGPLASRIHDDPSAGLPVVAITGTNGKTTTAFLTAAGLTSARRRPIGLMSTVTRVIGGQTSSTTMTTPEAPEAQRSMRRMKDAGDGGVVLEASSFGLEVGRLRGTRVAVAVFTNLTEEHLDLHRDMAAYFEAKCLLFEDGYTDQSVINIDDGYGRNLRDRLRKAGVEPLTVSIEDSGATTHVLQVEHSRFSTRADVIIDGHNVELLVGLPGRHNLLNALQALTAATAITGKPDEVTAGIREVVRVPGRMDPIGPAPGGPLGIVDYAHTPRALEALLEASRHDLPEHGRVIVVAGCGGGRDKKKRSDMGQAASNGADLFIATSDNPRQEDPERILDAMLSSLSPDQADHVLVEPNRREAIRSAVAHAGPDDVVVVAGKGHETYQEVAGEKYHFVDHEELAQALGCEWDPPDQVGGLPRPVFEDLIQVES